MKEAIMLSQETLKLKLMNEQGLVTKQLHDLQNRKTDN